MTVKKYSLALVTTLTMLLSFSSSAADSATDKLNVFVQSVVTFKANFKQTVIDPQGQVVEEAQGQFLLERPGKFRWDYKEPYPQQIVADGKRIWFYDADLEQVTVQLQKEVLADTPATLLSGEDLPEDKYVLTDIPSDDGMAWVKLVPKEVESNFQTVTLAFDQNGLAQMIMQDSFGQRTRLAFHQVEENVELEKDDFVFTPPAGVDVVGDSGL
jgi:outer membrane lipoprotein carrier protein